MTMLHIFRVITHTVTVYFRSAQNRAVFTLFPLLILSACSSRLYNAPVVDRSASLSTSLGTPPGYYRVKKGDTLYRIATEQGQSTQAIAEWNNLQKPEQIEVGQLLQVTSSVGQMSMRATGAQNASPQAQPFNGAPIAFSTIANPRAQNSAGSYEKNASVVGGGIPVLSTSTTSPPSSSKFEASNIVFAWPVSGPVLGTFNESKNKGIDIGGVAGTPVKAASDGRVVYAGNGLRGYGNLIIIKHDNLFLSAYAHNRLLYVQEGKMVQKGQKIAEMGNSDAEKVMLHFEIRKQGKPVDPLKYLPDPPTSADSKG